MAQKYDCTACRKQVTATKNQRYRSHTNGDGEPCEMSSTEIPEHVLALPVGEDDRPDVPREGIDFAVCPDCDRAVNLTKLGYYEHHTTTLRGDVRCAMAGVRFRREETVESPLLTEPGTTNSPKVRDSATPAANRGITGMAMPPELPDGFKEAGVISLESTSTSTTSPAVSSATPGTVSATSSDAPEETGADAGPFRLAPLLGDGSILQPFSWISQPFPVPPRVTLKEAMSEGGKERANRFREIFFSYGNRQTSDNRSAQTTLGPSEIGHECDRRLAMSLLGVEPVNPGGDGWAAWVGTQGHKGLDEVFSWASANTGRFATEVRLEFPSRYVPRGTTDLIDRTYGDIGDFKLMGEYSLKKLIEQGPPAHYRVQGHTYGLGATLAGEKIRNVVIYGLPRGGSSLDGMYVWTEPYDKKVAEAALARVDRIAAHAQQLQGPGTPRAPLSIAADFEVTPDCRYCPFFLKGDKEMRRGCPGR